MKSVCDWMFIFEEKKCCKRWYWWMYLECDFAIARIGKMSNPCQLQCSQDSRRRIVVVEILPHVHMHIEHALTGVTLYVAVL